MAEPAHSHLRHSGCPVHTVRMGMSVAEGEQLADILLRCPADVAERIHDQLWLRTLFIIQHKRTMNGERLLYDGRADRILAALDPQERSTFTLADAFDVDAGSRLGPDLSAPLPLGYAEALRRAAELREKGSEWTWPTIATVMSDYHGFTRTADWWRAQLRGRVTPRRRGRQFGEARDAT